MHKYYIHNNGGKPFLVSINNNDVKIYKNLSNDNQPFLKFKVEKYFIGKSPLNKMTKFSGGHGKKFDGNSILLKLSDNKYIYIGPEIYSFKPLDEIIQYVSPVGNNDVPYPYAIDASNNVYLMIEYVILRDVDPNKNDWDPYRQYYNNNTISGEFEGFYIGNDKYDFRYDPFPAKDYDRITKHINKNVYIKSNNGKKYKLSKEDYVKIVNSFAKEMNYKKLNTKLIQKRL